jgi:TetR/AcrR family transcriptional regulator
MGREYPARQPTLRTLRADAARYARPATPKESAILAAASRLFGEKGYEAARTADIAAAAGVTERTLFRYFQSKEHLYKRVMFPPLLAAAVPRALTDTGQLFAAEARSVADWHRTILKRRVAAAKQAAPQYRTLVAALMTDEQLRPKVIGIWKENVLQPLVAAIRRYQARGQLRSDLPAERLARAVISLNLGFIFARVLLAPDAEWNDEAEVEATVELLLRGAGVAESGI